VISRKSTMYGQKDYDIGAFKGKERVTRKVSGSAIKDAVNLLAQGALSANSDPCLANGGSNIGMRTCTLTS
jgi:hypothetical protein